MTHPKMCRAANAEVHVPGIKNTCCKIARIVLYSNRYDIPPNKRPWPFNRPGLFL